MTNSATTAQARCRDWLGDAPHDYTTLVRYATLAASSHNTQPWKFALGPGRITILPDLSRRCPQVDPDDHHLYASLGCAATNLLLAAQAAGLPGHCRYNPATDSVIVDLEEGSPSHDELFEALPRRQCSRSEYDGSSLSGETLRLLESIGCGDGVSVLLLTDARQKERVADYVAAGNAAQFADPRWSAEMRKWIRFSARRAERTGDGLRGPVMGNPSIPEWMGRVVMPLVVSAERQSRKDRAHIRSSSAIAVFVSEVNDKAHWVEAGRCYERFALLATAMGLRTAFVNQPVEVTSLRAQFADYLGLGGRRPDLVVRIGRGPEMPRSLRRPVAEVLV